MRKIIFFFFLLSFFVGKGLFAQVVGSNLAFLPEYKERLPYFQELITGGQYQEPSRLIEGDPYYYSRQFEKGSLTINGITYPEVPLLYDVYRDQVITFHPVFNQKILIKPEKIDGFALANGARFTYFPGNGGHARVGNGIYQVLGESGFYALAKRYKTTKSKRELSKYDEIYVEKTEYFLWKEGDFFLVAKEGKVLDVLGLEKREVRKQLKAKGLNFKRNPEPYLQYIITLAPG
ncbi:hypothetical protein J0A68_05460 [Algoriphagus sp. H41]|uniref:WG containing repeat-containing protein n=1 Tax=Algoriphagus oliviformis TaxID=2811231 RepID=A0ABS3C2M9_9BACT|nr:hypothetical protein [Algoriphagus oliviformis]MBN7810391.1 hypothetical protein [Algoriphagus oliviformis]